MNHTIVRTAAGLACCCMLAASCALLAGCSSERGTDAAGGTADDVAATQSASLDGSSAAEEKAASRGAVLQPADHEGRFESGGADLCIVCHDVDAVELSGATALPESHYVTGDDGERSLDPLRNQCVTCHVVDLS